MRKLFANVLAAAALMAAWCSPSPVMAQSSNDGIPPIEEWNFEYYGYYDLGGLYYRLDWSNKLAEFIGFSQEFNDSIFAIPSVIEYGMADPMTMTETTEQFTVVSVDYYTYYSTPYNCRSITVPATVRRMKSSSLSYFNNLETIEILGSNIQEWGSNVFNGSNNGTMLTVRMHTSEPPTIDRYLNSNSDRKIKIVVPTGSLHAYRVANWSTGAVIVEETPVAASVELDTPGTLGTLVLDNVSYLSEINKLKVSGTLNRDDWSAFALMSNLISVDLSEVTNTEIPSNTFEYMGLEEVILPAGLKSIGSDAFLRNNITQLELPETLNMIGSSAFKYNNIASLVFPKSLVSLGSYAFQNNRGMKTLELNEGLTQIPYDCFSNCSALNEVVMPSTLKTIDSYAFDDCTSLNKLELNEGLTSLGYYSFGNTNLTDIVLPSSLQSIEYPFASCMNVKTITCNSLIPPVARNGYPIIGSGVNATLRVPKWALSEYMLSAGWSDFAVVEASDIAPQNIIINKDFVVAFDQEVESDYRPNISLKWTTDTYYDDYDRYNYRRGNLTISNRGKIAANSLEMYFSPYAKHASDYHYYYSNGYDYCAENPTCLIINGEMRSEDVTIHLMLRNNQWQFVSFPFDVKMSDVVPDSDSTMWVIREYDGLARAEARMDETWVNLSSTDVLKAGHGYIMHCYYPDRYGSGSRVNFTVKPDKSSVTRQNIFVSTDMELALEENLSEFAHNRSWNLIGNPYPSYYDSRYMDFKGILTVWNSYANDYRAYSTLDDDYILSPGESFFVQRPVDQETIVFDKNGRQKDLHVRELSDHAPTRANAAVRQLYNIELSSNGLSDRTRVVFNEYASADYELDKDASKFMAMDKALPQIYTISGSARYAINERPEADGKVALGIHCGETGEYTIALSQDVDGEVVLEDALSGARQVITADKGYIFSAEAGDINGRFFLNIAPDATGIESIVKENVAGNSFNLMGQPVDASARGIIVRDGQKLVK